MKRYLLDSNALNAYIYRRSNVYARAMAERRKGEFLGTGIPIVAEILGGALFSQSWSKNVPRVETALNMLRLWPFEISAAREYARLFAEMNRSGIQMQAIDRMVAAIALTLPNCTVVTNDSDFSRVPGFEGRELGELTFCSPRWSSGFSSSLLSLAA